MDFHGARPFGYLFDMLLKARINSHTSRMAPRSAAFTAHVVVGHVPKLGGGVIDP